MILDLTSDHYHDIGVLLSSCSNVISADIPAGLDRISSAIRGSGKADEFLKVNAKDGVEWLKENCPTGAQELQSFLDVHGHRSYKEASTGFSNLF